MDAKSAPWSAALILALLAAGAGYLVGAPVLANPLPDCAVLVHVQPLEAGYCDTSPIATCEQVVQHTEETGLLEFDLFVYTPAWGENLPVGQLSGTCEWSPQWQFVGYEICHGGVGTVDVFGDGASLDLTWFDCPTMSGEVFLAIRLFLEVPSYGQLSFPAVGSDGRIVLYCPPDSEMLWVGLVCSGDAGVVCDYCELPCDLTPICNPRPSPSVLELECAAGGSAGGEIEGHIDGHDELNLCEELTAETDADWLQLELCHDPLAGDFRVAVEADAGSLSPGIYEAWVRLIADCAGCTRVVLTVHDPQSVPEEDPGSPAPGIGRATSWGRLKQIYR